MDKQKISDLGQRIASQLLEQGSHEQIWHGYDLVFHDPDVVVFPDEGPSPYAKVLYSAAVPGFPVKMVAQVNRSGSYEGGSVRIHVYDGMTQPENKLFTFDNTELLRPLFESAMSKDIEDCRKEEEWCSDLEKVLTSDVSPVYHHP
ncbi:hypothetical protein GOV11_02010 [Candidatus Woesearchaeota archaeon]|nr:hypothetical protein [Candidatus Woesearchaeota archaeon]